MTISSPTASKVDSALFTPLAINNGKIQLAHRVILAPLTRNRGTPLKAESTAEDPNRVWLPNEMMAEYYSQRASKGGLIITEGVPPSLEVCWCFFLFSFFFSSLLFIWGWFFGDRSLLMGGADDGVGPRDNIEVSPCFRDIVGIGRSSNIYRGS